MIDVSLFPVFKSQTLSMLGELDSVFSNEVEVNKSAMFETILKKYNCMPT